MRNQECIAVFSGTSEGRQYSKELCEQEIRHYVCVATTYGRQVMEESPFAEIVVGRMDAEEMKHFFVERGITKVVDATHPYAVEVKRNIKTAITLAEKDGILYERIDRPLSDGMREGLEEAVFVPTMQAAAEFLKEETGNILLTTGSKAIEIFCLAGLKNRLYARILPSCESLQTCLDAGISGSHLIAMQGPFSVEMNLALLRRYDIKWLVTKDSGKVGGLYEKAEAARQNRAHMVVIEPPLANDRVEQAKNIGEYSEERKRPHFDFVLCGMGSGSGEKLTGEVKEALGRADFLFGSKRILGDYKGKLVTEPLFQPDSIISCLERYAFNGDRDSYCVVIAFSGDTGFFSGSQKVYRKLCERMDDHSFCGTIRILPGVSSVAMLAAQIGVSYEDARFCSIHGRSREDWESRLADACVSDCPLFLLLSDGRECAVAGRFLTDRSQGERLAYIGYDLGTEQEEIRKCQVSKLENEPQQKGACILCIMPLDVNKDRLGNRLLVPILVDSEFDRVSGIPMTKQEIRHIIFGKLSLGKDSVFFDIGSGTGSIAVTAAKAGVRTFAFESDPAACELIRKNAVQHHVVIRVIHGEASEQIRRRLWNDGDNGSEEYAWREYTEVKVTNAFIGGSNGKLRDIYRALMEQNPRVRIVLTAITVETLAECYRLREEYRIRSMEVIRILLSREKELGKYHRMSQKNEVYIISMGG